MSEWKPGDVLVDKRGLIFFCIEVSENTRTAWRSGACLVSPDGNGVKAKWLQGLRRLVTIDPEDAEQVERLASLAVDAAQGDLDEFKVSNVAALLTDALREFARPTPRVEEPKFPALIADGDGECWALHVDGSWTCLHSKPGIDRPRTWAALLLDYGPIRVLFHGPRDEESGQ